MLRSVLTVGVFLILAAPAGAQERVCHGQLAPPPPATQAEQEVARLQDFARQRAQFGFRYDIPYVRELVARGVWEYDVGYIPVTPRENRYLKLRDELELGAKAERYLREHRDVDGGVNVRDAWPRDPYLEVRFTKDVTRNVAAIKRLARDPQHVRGARARYSLRELERLNDRVYGERKALAKAGFHLVSSSVAFAGYVELDVVTRRTDARTYFRKRYGAGAFKLTVYIGDEYSLSCAAASSYEIAPDGLALTVRWNSGGGAKPIRIEVTEFADHVEVGAVERIYNGPRNDDATILSLAGALTAPLGDRPVIDAANGLRLRQRGAGPGDPACPAKPAPSRLERAIEARRMRGLPTDPAYVQRQLDRGRLTSQAEERWAKRLSDLVDDERLDAYLRKHADDFAGSQPLAVYPDPPRVVFRFTRDLDAHLAALRKLTKHPEAVSVEQATYPIAQLRTVDDAIEAELEAGRGFLDAFGDAGFYVSSHYADDAADVVVVRVVTPRGDAAEYFAARFGAAVRVEVIGDRYECTVADAYR
ncbi:hypothetical protein OM076_21705 [Solirubrobacter ginsenosidimutans]|uniref:ADP ribosyltransferase domain-containing protein n=1 Tax=Solirubrobacter ginsenosidimutans TaxID=490573 RepID=A0A9X3MX12_9ACTN|nr:hypothetical protein [Solirubrobacter ginsenosidimutans]MDA0162903.1 hypothetical protein [Solirubrobacter ginsenosidimutans]